MGNVCGKTIPETIAQSNVHIVNPKKQTADGKPYTIGIFSQTMKRYGHQQQNNNSRPSLDEKRTKDISHPRQIIMYLCRSMTNATYIEIASLLGGRDHTTILHGERNIANLIENDESVRRTIETIINKLKSN